MAFDFYFKIRFFLLVNSYLFVVKSLNNETG